MSCLEEYHALSDVKTTQPAVTRRSGLAGVIDEEEITDQRVTRNNNTYESDLHRVAGVQTLPCRVRV